MSRDGHKKRFLLISGGSIGQRHLLNLRLLQPKSEIGVLHLTNRNIKKSRNDPANVHFTSIDEAINFKPIAIIIASPASTHLEIATIFSKLNVPMMIEKPISVNADDVKKLINLTKKTTVMVAYNLRFSPSLKKMRELVENKTVGEIISAQVEVGQYLPLWRPNKRYQDTVSAKKVLGGGALLELSHEFDYLYWMFGLPDHVVASGGKYSSLDINVEDLVSVNLEYNFPKRLIHLHLDFIQMQASRTCKLIGTLGSLHWCGITNKLKKYDISTKRWILVPTEKVNDNNQIYIDELTHFLNCVFHGEKSAVNLESALDVMKIIDATRTSIETKSRIRIVKNEK